MDKKNTIEKLLEKPNFTNIELAIEKARNKLIILSFLSIFISKFEINLENGLKFLGIKISNITLLDISITLSIVIIYLVISLVWASWNRWLEWNIRRTGVNEITTKVKGFSHNLIDYPDDHNQSTLYRYWREKKQSIENIEKFVSELNKNEFDNRKLDLLNNNLSSLRQILYDDRIETSLKRFDESYFKKINSENWRSILFDSITPIVFALGALYYLCDKNIFV